MRGGTPVVFTDESIRTAVDLYKTNPDECERQYGPISQWDVSQVTDLSDLFADRFDLSKADLSKWDVSNVTNMVGVFSGSEITFSLSKWSVKNVTNMRGMFSSCHQFDQSLKNWDVSNVTDMSNMFYGCGNFNQPVWRQWTGKFEMDVNINAIFVDTPLVEIYGDPELILRSTFSPENISNEIYQTLLSKMSKKSFKTAVEGYLPFEGQRGPNNTEDIADNPTTDVLSKNTAGKYTLASNISQYL